MRASWLVGAAAALLAYGALYGARLDRPGLQDEAFFSGEAYGRMKGTVAPWIAGDPTSELMTLPYVGGAKMELFRLLYRFARPDIRLLRLVNLLFGIPVIALSCLLAATLIEPAGAAALLMAALLLTDPTVFINLRHEFGPVSLPVGLLLAGALLGRRALDRRSAAAAGWAGLCCGLACWNHLLAAIPLAATAAVRFWRAPRPDAAERRLAAALAGGFLAGFSPFLVWLFTSGHWLQLGVCLGWPPMPMSGSGWQGWLPLAGANPTRLRLLAAHADLARRLLSGWGAYDLFGVDVAAPDTRLTELFLLVAVVQWARGRLRFAPEVVLSFALLCYVSSFYGVHHVFLALYPWIYLPIADLASEAFQAAPTASWRRAAAALPAAACLSLNLRSLLPLRTALLADRVNPVYTAAAQADLDRVLRPYSGPVVDLDTAAYGIEIITRGRLSLDESLIPWIARPDLFLALQPEWQDWAARRLRDPKSLYVLTDEGRAGPIFMRIRKRLMSLARHEGLRPVLLGRAGDGRRPLFQVYRFDSASSRKRL